MEARFAKISRECVSLFAETVGLLYNEAVAPVLFNDVSYKLRQTLNVACHFLHVSKRKRMSFKDFERAVKWMNIEPIFGHSSALGLLTFQSVHEGGIYSLVDNEQRVSELFHESLCNLQDVLHDFFAVSKWFVIEGTPVYENSHDIINGSYPVLVLKASPTSPQRHYLILLLEAVNSNKEEVRQVALHDLSSNAAVANVLPYLYQFVQDIMTGWLQCSSGYLVRFLRMINAIFENQNLYLHPYAENIMKLVQSIMCHPSFFKCSGSVSHWEVRELAAYALSVIVQRCSTPLTKYYSDLYSTFSVVLVPNDPILPVVYSVVLTLCHLGGESIAIALLPRLINLTKHIQTMLNAAQVAVELLLSSNYGQSQSCHNIVNKVYSFEQLQASSPLFVEEVNHEVSLYELLVELFGERLILKLNTHFSTVCNKIVASRNPSRKVISYLSNTCLQNLINLSFSSHQRREGFMSLHHLICSQRLVTVKKDALDGQFSFCLKKYRLPVIHNVFEFHTGHSHLCSDVCHGLKHGNKKGFPIDPLMYDVSSCWL